MSPHIFYIEDLSQFTANLEARRYSASPSIEENRRWITYSRTLSQALTKYYSYEEDTVSESPVPIRVTYSLIKGGKALQKLAKQLKLLNAQYRQSLPDWKTKPKVREEIRDKRWMAVQKFLREHADLIACFKYQADDRLTEGNNSFNMEIASTPKEQAICYEFIRALVDAYTPHGIVRGRRGIDKPRIQRNGWIKRYAEMHRKRGWSPVEISRQIQKELREGTWNERSRLQYNLAQNTILRIAGMKATAQHAHSMN